MNKNQILSIAAFMSCFMIVGQRNVEAQSKEANLKNWPKGTSPKEIGTRVANHFIVTPHTNFNKPGPPKVITYPETCAWYGALTFAKQSGNKEMVKKLADRFEPLFGEEAKMIPVPDHVDYTVFGSVPLELYIQTKNKKYLDLGL